MPGARREVEPAGRPRTPPPGILLTAHAFLREHPAPTREEIREMLAGNLCRCTGYHFIVEAIDAAARVLRDDRSG